MERPLTKKKEGSVTLTLASLSEGKNKFRRDETESEPSNSDFGDDRELENLTEHEIGDGSHVMTNIPSVRNLALTSAGTRELEKGRDIKMELEAALRAKCLPRMENGCLLCFRDLHESQAEMPTSR